MTRGRNNLAVSLHQQVFGESQGVGADATLRVLIDSSQRALFSTQANGVLTAFNPAAVAMLGYAPDELLFHQTPARFLMPAELEHADERTMSSAWFTLAAERARDEESPATFLHKDGRHVDVLLSVRCLCDAHGRVTGYLGMARLAPDDVASSVRRQASGEGGTEAPCDVVASSHATGEISVSQVLIAHSDERETVTHLSTIAGDLRPQTKTQALLTQVAAHAPGMLFELQVLGDGTLHFSYVSAGVRELYELSASEVTTSSEPLLERVHPDDRAHFLAAVLNLDRAEPRMSLEYRRLRADGEVRWHQGQASGELCADGSIVWHGFITDITEQRRAHEELRQAKERLEDAIASLDAGFAMYDPGARLVVCNRQFSEIQGIPSELCYPGADYAAILRGTVESNAAYQAFLPSWLPLDSWIQSRLEQLRSERTSQVLKLEDRWVRLDTRRVSDGGTVLLATDISALKRAEFDARVQGQRLSLAAAASEIGIWDLDLVTSELVWDARMLAMYGFTDRAFPARYETWKECVHRDDIEMAELTLRNCLASGSEFKHRFRIVQPNGTIRYIDARAGFVRDISGKMVRMIGVNLDATEQVETERRLRTSAEAAEASTRAKAEFLATMSHEIRTPMNGVIGMTNLLIGTRLDAEQRSFVETIRVSGESLLTLINDILDFSKMEAGKLELERIAFSLTEQVHEVVNLFGEQAERKGLTLTVHAPEPSQSLVWGDPTRVRQVLLNLVSNALKFTEAGFVRLQVELVPTHTDLVNVVLQVTDTGIGMTEAQIQRLGDAFTQADTSTTRQFGGTGLGISICKKLVRMMSGGIEVESQRGKGTTFRVNLPMRVAALTDLPSRSSLVPRSSQRLLRILVAEDNIVNQRVVTLMLKKYAKHIDLATNGAEAIERFTHGEYDCVLMDGQMPEVDGLEATRRIREFEAEGQRARTPIIALTANALPGDRDVFLAAGMDEYLSKPLRPRDLALVLARVEAGEFAQHR